MFVLNYPQVFKINGLNLIRSNCSWLVKLVKKTPTRTLLMLQPEWAGLGVFLICLWGTGKNGKCCRETEMRKLKGNVLMNES